MSDGTSSPQQPDTDSSPVLDALDALDVALCVLNRDGTVIQGNPAWDRLMATSGTTPEPGEPIGASADGAPVNPVVRSIAGWVEGVRSGATCQVDVTRTMGDGPNACELAIRVKRLPGASGRLLITCHWVRDPREASEQGCGAGCTSACASATAGDPSGSAAGTAAPTVAVRSGAVQDWTEREPAALELPAPGLPAPGLPGSGMLAPSTLVANHTDSAITITDPDGVIEWVSDAFTKLTGFSREEAIGVNRLDLVHGPFLQSQAFEQFRSQVLAGRPASVESAQHRKDGSLYWSSWDVRPVSVDGRVVRLVAVERDITKRRRAEEQARQSLVRAQRLGAQLRAEKQLLTSVLGTIPHAVWWADHELRRLGCNEAFLRLRGLASIAEVIGRTEAELAADAADAADQASDSDAAADPSAAAAGRTAAEQINQLELEVLATGTAITDRKIVLTGAPGGQRTLLVSVLPRAEARQVAGVLGVAADLSEISELERQLAQTSRLESIGQLAAGIAHEINTPVQYASDNTRFVADSFGNVLRGLREVAELAGGDIEGDSDGDGDGDGDSDSDSDSDGAGGAGTHRPEVELRHRLRSLVEDLDLEFVAEEVPSALTQSLEGLDRVAQIVRAMKEFSHPGGERLPTELNRLVESTIQVCRNEWKYVAELNLDLDPAVGEVPCFEGDVKQAVLNLLVNAAHAIGERRRVEGTDALGTLCVSTHRNGAEVSLVVEDDGIGMDEAVRSRVFDPFFTTKEVGKGTGQGLNLAHSAVVTKHQGRILVSSEPMRGAVFTVVLPAPPVADETSEVDGSAGSVGSPGVTAQLREVAP